MILGGRQRVDSRDTRPPKTPSSSKATPTGSEWKSLNREIAWKINDVNGKEGFCFQKGTHFGWEIVLKGQTGIFPGVYIRYIKTPMATIFYVMSIYCAMISCFSVFKAMYEL